MDSLKKNKKLYMIKTQIIHYFVQIQVNMNKDLRLFVKHVCIIQNAIAITVNLTSSFCQPIIDAVGQSNSTLNTTSTVWRSIPQYKRLKDSSTKAWETTKDTDTHARARTKRWQHVTFLALSASWWGRVKRGRWEQKSEEEVFND